MQTTSPIVETVARLFVRQRSIVWRASNDTSVSTVLANGDIGLGFHVVAGWEVFGGLRLHPLPVSNGTPVVYAATPR